MLSHAEAAALMRTALGLDVSATPPPSVLSTPSTVEQPVSSVQVVATRVPARAIATQDQCSSASSPSRDPRYDYVSVCELVELLTIAGRPISSDNPVNERRRVTRPDSGVASRVALLLDTICADVSEARGLNRALTVRDVMKCREESQFLIENLAKIEEAQTLATNAVVLADIGGRAMTKEVVGILSRNIPTSRAATLFKVDQSTVLRYVTEMHERSMQLSDEKGPFQSLQMRPGASRKKISDSERISTEEWFLLENPTRSGDVLPTGWMTLSKEDFYYSIYRGDGFRKLLVRLPCFVLLMPSHPLSSHVCSFASHPVSVYMCVCAQRFAMNRFPDLMEELKTRVPCNVWERNLKIFASNDLAPVKKCVVPPRLSTAPLPIAAIKTAAQFLDTSKEFDIDALESVPLSDDLNDADVEGKDDEVLQPRSFKTLYRNILKGIRIRRAPPVPYCPQCITADDVHLELEAVTKYVSMLTLERERKTRRLTVEEERMLHESFEILSVNQARFGNSVQAQKMKLALTNKVATRQQHVRWYLTQRLAVRYQCVRSICSTIRACV